MFQTVGLFFVVATRPLERQAESVADRSQIGALEYGT